MTKPILGGWYYPAHPCNPDLNTIDNFKDIKQLCGEFLRFTNDVQPDGSLIQVMTESYYGMGGYTPEHIEKLKSVVPEPYCTISGRAETGVEKMLEHPEMQEKSIQKIVKFCKQNGLHADLNIEGLAAFSQEECHLHAKFIDQLGKALKAENIKFRVVTVAEDGTLFHGAWRNDLLRNVTCDYVVCMQYDRMYDHGRVGVTPIDFLKKTTANIKKSLGDSWREKYICGLPNYGYKAYQDNPYWVELVTRGQLAKIGLEILPTSRDPDSHEITWESVSTVRGKPEAPVYYFYNDQKALDEKTKIMLGLGVNKFSLWHIFGYPTPSGDRTFYNPWWSDEMIKAMNGGNIPETNTPPEEIIITDPTPEPVIIEDPVIPDIDEDDIEIPYITDTEMDVVVFTGTNMGGLSKRYFQGQYNLHGDNLIKPNTIKELIIKGQGKIIMYDGVFENPIYTFENKQDARQYIQLGEQANKVDSFVITGLVQAEPIPEPTPEPVIPDIPEFPIDDEDEEISENEEECDCERIRSELEEIRDRIDELLDEM